MQSVKRVSFFAAAFAAMLLCSSVTGYAQKIGVIDATFIQDLPEYKAAMDKMQAASKMWNDTLATMANNYKATTDKYQKIASTMSDDAKQKAAAELDQLQQTANAYQNAKFNQQNGEMVKMQADLLGPIRDKIKKEVETVAKKRKIDIVLQKDNAVFVGEGVTDLTDDVKKALK